MMPAPKPKLLLHICCGPCATYPLELLRKDFEVEGYFYNPNIHPPEEYERRLAEAKRWAQQVGLNLVEGAYDMANWLLATEGLEHHPEGGVRCEVCFALRLNEAARYAQAHGFPWLATTLTLSPHKNARRINEIGERAAGAHGIRFHPADFRKQAGVQRARELSRHYGLYRQNYCGCVYSLRDKEP